ncbi:MAG: PDGLE domain-containing protein, partial [Chthoniobacteraceae bacterium]|nr:PDGLE domain-containing protein [Chthoniobacteraceae bacterium]
LQFHTPVPDGGSGGWRMARPFWIGVAVLVLATPLGLLAAGTAWGEWGAEDFAQPATRQAIAEASLHAAPPAGAPRGMARLAAFWKAPLPDYAPPFLRGAAGGYVLCAALGVGLTLAASLLLHRALNPHKSYAGEPRRLP